MGDGDSVADSSRVFAVDWVRRRVVVNDFLGKQAKYQIVFITELYFAVGTFQ